MHLDSIVKGDEDSQREVIFGTHKIFGEIINLSEASIEAFEVLIVK